MLITFSSKAIDFTMNSDKGCTPFRLGVNVIDIVPDSALWDFGNGIKAKGIAAFNIYSNPGNYTVTLKVYKAGIETVITKNIQVFTSPVADFEFDPSIGCPPLLVKFKDKTTTGTAPIKEWTWDFGNGKSLKGTEANPTLTYISSAQRDVSLVVEDQNGCKNIKSYPKAITILPTPNVDFDFKNSNSCALPIITTTNNKSTSNLNLTYEWDFGDGSAVNTSDEPSHTYIKEGDFPISLVATDENGCKSQLIKNNLIVDENFSVDIILSDTLGCDSIVAHYDAYISSLYQSMKWTFDPGLTVDQVNKIITCKTPGEYIIKLEAVSRFGCNVSMEKKIIVSSTPKADFVSDQQVSCKVPFTVNFTNLSTGATKYQWALGDGRTSVAVNPTFSFNKYRSYAVSLTASNDDGCSSKYLSYNYIQVLEPRVEIVASNEQGCIPLSTKFSINELNGFTVSNASWDFGNGNTYNGKNPPSQTYNNPGKYTVKAVISFAEGCDNITVTKQIEAGSSINFNASLSTTSLCPSELLKGTADIISNAKYEWIIGNIDVIESRNLSYKFKSTGSYNISLKVTVGGCSNTKLIGKVTIKGVAASYTLLDDCNGLTVRFRNNNYNDVQSTWNFGDGTVVVDNNRIVIHKFNNYGIYDVKLKVFNNSTGCFDEIVQKIEVKKRAAEGFVLNKVKGCSPLEINFKSIPNSKFNNWYLNDTILFKGDILNTSLTQPGKYNLKYAMIVDGCRDTLYFDDLIQVIKPDAGFKFDPIGGCAPITSTFEDTSKSDFSTIKTYNWDLGGLGTKSGKSFTETFALTATVPISLFVEDNFGCKDTVKHDLVVAYPFAKFNVPSSSFCTGNSFKPRNLSTGVGLKYYWDFGDGSPVNTDSAPQHIYQNEGVYDITLAIVDANNCSDTAKIKNAVTISDIKYDFDGSPRNKICPELLTQFEIVPANITYKRTFWDFGNGNTSDDTTRFPTNLYLKAGTFDVTLALEDYRGCVDTIRKEKFIDIGGPSGEFIVSDTSACVPIEISIEADIRNSVANFWDYDDGSGSYDTLAKSTTKHTYTKPGVYRPSVTVDDGLGCIATVYGPEIRVGGPTAHISASSKIACNDELILFADTSTFDPNAPLGSRSWSISDGYATQDSSFSVSFNTADSTYYNAYLTVTDSLGCYSSDTMQFAVFAFAPLYVQDSFKICKGDSIRLFASGVYDYQWGNYGTLSDLNIHNPIAFPLQTTDYSVRGLVSPTCYTDKMVHVDVIDVIKGTVGPDTIICSGDNVTLWAEHDTIDSGEFKYKWYLNNQLIDSVIPLTVTPDASSTYVLNIENGSCKEANLPVFIEVKDYPSLSVVDNVNIFVGQEAKLEAYSDEGVTYSWSPNQSLSCVNCPFPTSTTPVSQIYSVTVTNQYGCSVTEDVSVNILEACNDKLITIQNVFTPNFDGLNDKFTLKNNDFLQLEKIRIYARTGEMVYESSNIEDAWDGTYNGVRLNSGVYVYYVEARCINGDPILLKGNVTLIR